MKKGVLFLFFALGFFSLLAQTLVIREFIVSFGGNELGIGLFYFFWLFWVGIGSLLTITVLGKFLHKHFLKLLLLYPFIAFLQSFLFISLKSAAGVSWWEFFTFEKVFLYLFIFTSFISFFTGIIFTLGALWFKSVQRDLDASATIAYAYVFEALGSFVAGCVATVLIAKFIPPVVILLIAASVFSLASLIASIKFKDKVATIIHLAALVIFSIFLIRPAVLINTAHQARRLTLIPEGKFVDEVYTPYQHIFVASLPAQRVVFSNGSILSSFPEVIDADTQSALCASQYGKPRRILVFGTGAENLITSFLKL